MNKREVHKYLDGTYGTSEFFTKFKLSSIKFQMRRTVDYDKEGRVDNDRWHFLVVDYKNRPEGEVYFYL